MKFFLSLGILLIGTSVFAKPLSQDSVLAAAGSLEQAQNILKHKDFKAENIKSVCMLVGQAQGMVFASSLIEAQAYHEVYFLYANRSTRRAVRPELPKYSERLKEISRGEFWDVQACTSGKLDLNATKKAIDGMYQDVMELSFQIVNG